MGLSLVAEDFESPQGANGEAFRPRPEALSPRSAAPLFPTKEVIAVLGAIGAILGARLAILLAGLGAFLLATHAAQTPGFEWSQVIYGVTAVALLVVMRKT